MSAFSHPVPVAHGSRALYRSDHEEGTAAWPHLRAARDALEMAILSLEGEDGGDEVRRERNEQARAFLVEAVQALGRARVHDPRVKALSTAVVTAGEATPEAETHRLYALATRLTWDNHAVLPTKEAAGGLAPEDERQVARLVAAMRRSSQVALLFRDRGGPVGWFTLEAVASFLLWRFGVVGWAAAAALFVTACGVTALSLLILRRR